MKNPKFKYDKVADVMYISFGKPKPCRCYEPSQGGGIVIRYTIDKNELNGITIVDYKKRV